MSMEWRLGKRSRVVAVAAAATLALAACGSRVEGGSDGSHTHSASAGDTSRSPVPPVVTLPGRVALSADTCGRWTAKDPESPLRIKPLLLANDARFNKSVDCDAQTDTGSGTYSAPTFLSPTVDMKQGHGSHILDGEVVEVVGYTTHGQPTNDAHNGPKSTIWLKVEATPNGPEAWVSNTNVGWVALQTLETADIPMVTTVSYDIYH